MGYLAHSSSFHSGLGSGDTELNQLDWNLLSINSPVCLIGSDQLSILQDQLDSLMLQCSIIRKDQLCRLQRMLYPQIHNQTICLQLFNNYFPSLSRNIGWQLPDSLQPIKLRPTPTTWPEVASSVGPELPLPTKTSLSIKVLKTPLACISSLSSQS